MNLTAQAGLTLVLETMLALDLDTVVDERLSLRSRRRGATEFDTLAAIVLLLAAGGESIEDVRVLARDPGLERLLGRALPSPDALHRFLLRFHDESSLRDRPAEGAFIPDESGALQALHEVNVELVRRATLPLAPRQATLDLDATVIESHKREARAHYKGGRGYQPTAVLWAEQELVVADQYRDGNVPAGMRTLEVARRGFDTLPASVAVRRFRADSACYEERVLKHMWREQIAFTISADMSPELRRACAARSVEWTVLEERSSERVELADVEFVSGDWPRDAPPLRYVALRFTGKQGRLFADGEDVKYLAVVSNRREVSAAQVVRWHWEKAGTIEHAHDVTKNELGARLPPSGRFGANAAWYRLNLIAFNVLRVLRMHALPERFERARPRRLRFELFALPAQIREHARRVTATLGAPALTAREVIEARGRLLRLHEAIVAEPNRRGER
jgi:hypothetical protein